MNFFKLLIAGLLLTFAISAAALEQVTYYHNDITGSPVSATDDTGSVLWSQSYDVWGSPLLGASGDPRGFTGASRDNETGLSDFQARWYSPEIGRLLALDPVSFSEENFHSFNLYSYANNNPYRYIDPDGQSPFSMHSSDARIREIAVTDPAFHARANELQAAAAITIFTRGAGVVVSFHKITQAAKASKDATTGAESAVNGLKLNKSLASQSQMGEAGTTMAGARVPFRDAPRVAREHGGKAADWTKKTSSSHTARDGTTFETHWVENIRTGQRVEFKTKFPVGD